MCLRDLLLPLVRSRLLLKLDALSLDFHRLGDDLLTSFDNLIVEVQLINHRRLRVLFHVGEERHGRALLLADELTTSTTGQRQCALGLPRPLHRRFSVHVHLRLQIMVEPELGS